MAHTFDPASATSLDEVDRFRFLSRDELVAAVGVEPTDTIADIGSGTGFYTREVAPYVDHLYAVDIQDEMHAHFADRDIPTNVEQVLSPAASLPFSDESLDGLFTTMTFHEISDAAPAEFYRVLKPSATMVVADWSAKGAGERGPPTAERVDAASAQESVEDVGFDVRSARERPETFFLEATRP